MAARGARSRKIVEKQINKEKDKREASKYAPLSARRDPAGVMSPIQSLGRRNHSSSGKQAIPSGFDSNSASSIHSKDSNGGSSSKLASAGAKIIRTVVPVQEQKFVTPEGGGRMTSAPRGRRGGVPPKVTEMGPGRKNSVSGARPGRSLESAMGFRPESGTGSGAGGRPKVPAGWEKTKVWHGGLTEPKQFRGFEHDDDMWMQDGNCLIFFAEETSDEDPKPMCRIHAQTLEQARSVFMINLLKYGEIIQDDDADSIAPSSSASAPNPTWPLVERGYSSLGDYVNDSTAIGALLSPRSPELTGQSATNPGRFADEDSTVAGEGNGHSFNRRTRRGEITHEIWFRAPAHITKPEVQRRHHMATRNYLALLYGRPLVGNDFFEMLSDLQNVMDTYYELNDPTERWNSAQAIMHYVAQRQLDDCRGNLSHALGLMAWCEQRNVQWEAGYLEGFVHASGMFSPKTAEMKEFKNLSQVSKHKLHNCYNALQLRLMDAEERLARFDFSELWYAEGVATGHPAQKAFDEMRQFLGTFYSTVWSDWPPKERDHQGHWLSRTVVNRLQADMGALYDYIVDRDVAWDVSEERHTRKWEMISRGNYGRSTFNADRLGLPVTNMLVGFDTMLKYEHIPHPFPLLPESNNTKQDKAQKKGLFGKIKQKEPQLAGPKEQYQMALAFNAATNVDRLGTSFKDNKLLDTFQYHEKSFPPSVISPADARLGRWMLVYAMLQVLSTLSVDVMGLKYSDKIRYFACPSLVGLPPWKASSSNNPSYVAGMISENGTTALMRDATQKLSYCWLAPTRWGTPSGSAGTLTPTPPAYEMSARGGTGSPAVTALPSIGPPPADEVAILRNAFAAQSLSELDGAAILRRQRSVNRNTLGSAGGLTAANHKSPPLLRSPVDVPPNPALPPAHQSGRNMSPTMAHTNIAALKSRSGELLLSDPEVATDITGATPVALTTAGGYSLMPPMTRTPPLVHRSTLGSQYYQMPQQQHHVVPNDIGMPPPSRPEVPARSPQREKIDTFLPNGPHGITVKKEVEVLRGYSGRGPEGMI